MLTLVLDINHWLASDGDLPYDNPRLFPKALRMVRFIEYGGPLAKLEGLMTLVQCRARPSRKRCLGLMWVVKQADDRIQAHCPVCHVQEVVIAGWQDTLWANGAAMPVPMTDD